MKLNPKEFKRFKELSAKAKAGKISSSEEAELAELAAKKNERGSNDLAWWNQYPELTKGAANVPFNYIAGTVIPSVYDGTYMEIKVPGIAVVHYQPAIGLSSKPDDAFNAQMRQLWLDMHRKYRGMGGYQRADLGLTILAIQGVFETLAKFERIYGVVNTYKVQNRNIPYTLFEAFHIAADTPNVMADFRYGLNVRIAKLQQLCLPKGISAIEASIVTVSNIFKDSENPRASLFAFDSKTFAVYDATTLSTGGCVKYKNYSSEMQALTPAGNPALSLTDMFRILDTQINALLEDDDIAKMCSDLIAAYGPENVMTVSYIPELYVVEPVHDYERLLQFHNLTIAGGVYSEYDSNVVTTTQAAAFVTAGYPVVIYQKDDVIQCQLNAVEDTLYGGYESVGNRSVPYSTSMSKRIGKNGSFILDTWVDSPGEMEVMCGTRFSSICSKRLSLATGKMTQYIYSFGTAVVCDVEYWSRTSTGAYVTQTWIGSETQSSQMQAADYAALLIDWHPLVYVSQGANYYVFGDLDNPCVITKENLDAIHNAALYSAYKIPNVSYIK